MGLCQSQQRRTYSSKRQSEQTFHKTYEVSTIQTKKSYRIQRTDFEVAPKIFVSLKRGDIFSFYNVEQILGEGTFGRVSLVTQKQTGIKRAIKQIEKDKILVSQKDCMIQEVNILKDLDHPNIVNIYELYQNDHNYYIVTEYLSGGELFDRIKQKNNLNESVVANYMKQILSAVNYCHQRNIIHRDLKPENILFVSKYEDNLKVIDFGTAKQTQQSTQLKQQTGTPYFLAPEVLNQNYNNKCDIWSCGVILYLILCGKPPFTGSDINELFRNIKNCFVDFSGSEWLDISQEAKSLILKLLEIDSVKRVTAEQALKDPWIVNNQKVDKINSKNLENLQSFHNKSKLTSAILQFISTQVMTSKEKIELIEGFKAIDKNGDGKLSKSELTECYMNLYNDEIKCTQLVDKIFKSADVDRSGTLDYTEFVVAYSHLQNLMAKEKLETTFKLFDKDGNGTISKMELQEILGGLALKDSQWNSMFEELDINGDGEVTYEEFTQRLIRDT